MIEMTHVIGGLAGTAVYIFSYFLFPYWMIKRSLPEDGDRDD